EKQMPFLLLFDAANVNECYRRSESVIPQQALAVANSSLSLSQSRLLARQLVAGAAGDPIADGDFIRAAFTRMLSRQPSAEELAMCERFLAGQTTRLADPDRLTAFAGGPKADIAPASE